MRKKDIFSLGIHQYELFWHNYNEVVENGDKEAIHQLRVSLKRLYAIKSFFLHDVNPLGQAQIENYFEPLRAVYKAVGKVRNIQVILDLAFNSSSVTPPTEIGSQFQMLIAQRLEKFQFLSKTIKLPSQKEFAHQFKKYIKLFYKHDEGKLERFIEENYQVAKFYINGTHPGELWHDSRTLIKQNYLLMQLAASIDPTRFNEKSVQHYRSLEQVLGEWHDWVVLKKYALRYEVTRACELDSFLKQISKEMAITEKSILQIVRS